MKMFGLKTLLAAGALALFGSQAGAVVVYNQTCPNDYPSQEQPVDIHRYLDLYENAPNVTLSCSAWGYGEPNGEGTYMGEHPEWTQIGKVEWSDPDTGNTGTSTVVSNGLAGWLNLASSALYAPQDAVGLTTGVIGGLTNDNDQTKYGTYGILWKFGNPHYPAEWFLVEINYTGIFTFDLFWDVYWDACPKNKGGELSWEEPGSCDGMYGLSHISLYGKDPTTTVPLPAGGALLLTALGGMALMRRRKLVAA